MQHDVVNGKEIRVIGMSRSGSHAIINWILSQWQGKYCYLNCTEAGLNPFHTARPLEGETCWRANYPLDFDAERAGRWSRKDLLIYNFEDTFLGPVARAEALHDAHVGRSGDRLDLLVLRDPFNLFASRIKSGCGSVSNRTALRIWKQHAREFAGTRRYLTANERLLVNFNRWASETNYRRGIASALRVRFTDAGRQIVPGVANGSSFDGVRFNGSASSMAVDRRWEHFVRDPAYASLFDSETVDLSRRIFGEIYAGASSDRQRSGSAARDDPDGMDYSGDVPEQRQQDVQPEVSAKPYL